MSGVAGCGEQTATHPNAAISCQLPLPPTVAPLEGEVAELEGTAARLAHEFEALVVSYEGHAAQAGRATLHSSTALFQGTIFLEEQLREAMASANGVLEGMTGIVVAVKGLEKLLHETRKVAQDVSLVEGALNVAEAARVTNRDI
ncbi:hypothetical protein TraAM80_02885 [Trypanosoma rangeli]|uniref:Uncharacterized protein n=1 Tax=Trypanosoma rangeli TaxID=5698 RepID=A0A3S5IRQ1_TRYRA|nr:uncharacterized protein TraAM80_02885 [Trypanosoma rangeli]RNF08128.1 hypothetical protein TraAM80_02885 [Trypanosoma rangeli]|eukprot:RNF08128.1 hypothetical protein TraAM80_02885 [Trypanosoma rangeli]